MTSQSNRTAVYPLKGNYMYSYRTSLCSGEESERAARKPPRKTGLKTAGPLTRARSTFILAGAAMFAIDEAISFGQNALPVCLWKENPHRLVSLWEMRFEAARMTGEIVSFMRLRKTTHPPRFGRLCL
jgi:hypothetical protein